MELILFAFFVLLMITAATTIATMFVHFVARVLATRPKLIADFRTAHRLWSVRLAAAGTLLMTSLAAFPGLWASAPPEVQALVPEGARALIPLLLFLATLAARVVKQAPATPAPGA